LLPGAVDVEANSADYDYGMLTITLPKHKAQARRIGITNKNA
jgi:HSP20 family molecular chaperone IbpA